MDSSPIVEEELPQIERNPWVDNFFRPLLITIMIMCFNFSVVNFTRLINPNWNGIYFLIGMLITTVEAIYSYRVLHYYRSRGTSVFRYRAAEWAVLIVLLKLLNFADKPLSFIWANLQAMWWSPLNAINLEFYMMLLLGLVSWMVATDTIGDFDKLYDPFSFRSDVIAPLDRLRARYFWGGVILVVISGFTQAIMRLGFQALASLDHPSIEGVIINVLIYFTLGLVLLSQANLTRLMMHWRVQKVDIAPGLARQWAKYGLIFLGAITFFVFFLPTRYTMGLLESAYVVIEFVIEGVIFVVQLLLLLLILPLNWLLHLMGMDSVSMEDVPVKPADPPPPIPESAMPLWLVAVQSLVFWLVALVVIGYLLKMYIVDHPEFLAALMKFRPLAFVVNSCKRAWQLLRGWMGTSIEAISERLKLSRSQSEGTVSGRGWSWLGLGKLSAKEQILYYYLNILRRAEKRKLARKTSETPFEYEPNLEQAVPDVQADVHEVTDIFVRARYSQEPFGKDEAADIKQRWRRIRKELRRSRSTKS